MGHGWKLEIMRITLARVKYDWEYFRFPELVTPHMVPYGDDTFEFVMVVSKIMTYPRATDI